MREKVGLKVVKALKRKDNGVTHAAIDVLCALMQVRYVDIVFVCGTLNIGIIRRQMRVCVFWFNALENKKIS